jgi:hypothetical protein
LDANAAKLAKERRLMTEMQTTYRCLEANENVGGLLCVGPTSRLYSTLGVPSRGVFGAFADVFWPMVLRADTPHVVFLRSFNYGGR